MKRLLPLFFAVTLLFAQPLAAHSARVFNAPRQTYRLLAKQFNGSADVFGKVNPSIGGTPLSLTSATGRSGMDGSVTISLGAGFTAPLLLTVFVWQADIVNTAKAGWVRLGANANQYSISVDSNYAMVNFSIPENTPFFILADKSVTGDVYTEAKADPNNANSASGY